jgi:hypothetical protein
MVTAAERLRNEMHAALGNVRAELNRIEILAAALDAFDAPVPDYEPAFHHLNARELDRFEWRDPSDAER